MSEKKILQNSCCFLVHLHWAFQTETDFCFVMDFVGGGDLHYHWKMCKTFPEKIVQFIAAELVLALNYLHKCGIIYRDLKPQNILLDLDGHLSLADFGLSKEVENLESALHTACGTPTYSAPEVLEGVEYSKSIDYWSLGIVLYQFLVGKPPYEFNGDFGKLLRSIEFDEVYFPKNLLSANSVSLLEGLLQKNPSKRLDDIDIIKRHPFFKAVDWDKLEVKKVPSPIKLTNSSKGTKKEDAKFFDPRYTKLPVHDEKNKEPHPDVPDFTVNFDLVN